MKLIGCKNKIDPTTKAKALLLNTLNLPQRQIAKNLNIATSSVNNIIHYKRNSNSLPYTEIKETTAIVKKEYEQLKDDILQTIITCIVNNKQRLLNTKLTPVQFCMLTDKFLLLSGINAQLCKPITNTLVSFILNQQATITKTTTTITKDKDNVNNNGL